MELYGSQPVDGRGLPLPAHSESLAKQLNLTRAQAEVLVPELRNALAPLTLYLSERQGPLPAGLPDTDRLASRSVARLISLCDAIAARYRDCG